MASFSSSSSPRNWRYNVFTSFHGPDTRIKFLSHLRQQFNYNGITMFDDNGIERSQIIAPALTKAIKESRIAIVLLSKNYASSSWCLDELLEILKCKEEIGQIVMTVFYEVDPSHVRKQTGDFGKAFNKTCDGKTEEKIKKWSQALTYVGNIAREHFQNWDNEAKMIEKISRDVSHKLNDTPSRDFDGMVGLERHLENMESLLDLAYDGAKLVGISGPAGIGKSTIARALHSRFSNRFQHTCFMDNLRENYKSGLAEYGLKVRLHEQFLSNILNLNGIRISHLGVIKDRLQDKKVLIILDDVEHLDQLETLANIEWFGPGSRVIVTTENKEILQQHGIIDVYPVGFPSGKEALMIFCLSAFRQTYPPVEFMNLADEVARICGKLPLGLHVLGSSLRGKSQADWIDELPRLKSCLDGRIESVLKVGYESLHENDQTLFLLIAIFFNHAHVDHVTSMLTKNNSVFRHGRLKTLVDRCLVHHENSKVVMHHLLQVMARQIISKQEPWKRQILIDAQEICYLLENAEGNRSTVGISFDVAEIDELILSARAFERMRNLLFLKVYDWWHNGKSKLHIPEEMEFLPCLRLLSWDAYPRKSLPRSFCPKNLVELRMPDSQLEKLWEGPQLLANLKTMNLSRSSRLKELPDLSNATNLESLDLFECVSLVELPSSISSLHKLHFLETNRCRSLEVIPTLTNLGSLEEIHMIGCLRLSSFPDIPTSIVKLSVMETMLEECPASLRHLSFLKSFDTSGSVNLQTFQTYLPTSVTEIRLENCGIESIRDCIKGLHNLRVLVLSNCKKLKSLPELPGSLECLRANDCESLERVSVPLNTPNAQLDFSNCFKLGRQARRAIIQQLFVGGWALLPGSKVPLEFEQRARGNLLTIYHSVFYRYKVGVVISTEFDHQVRESTIASRLLCRCIVMGSSTNMKFVLHNVSKNGTEHLLIFHASLPFFIVPSEVSTKIVFEFSSINKDFDIIECGVQILTDEKDGNNNGGTGDGDDKEDDEEGYKPESGEASKDKDEDMADVGNYESVSRKRPRKTMMITSATTNPKKKIQRRRLKRKMNHKSSLYSRSFRIALLELRSRRKPTPSKDS